MRPLRKILALIVGSVVLVATLVGCTDGEIEAVPELPENICWGAFADREIASLLPTGEEVTHDAAPFTLLEGMDAATCSLYIDGNIQFQATATRRDFESEIEWSSYEKEETEPIGVGKKGIIWAGGAVAYIVCEPSKRPSMPGEYINLSIGTFDTPDDKQARRALPALLEQFVGFTQRELKCT